MDNMNMSLDEIIKTRPKNHRRSSNRGGARAQVLGNAGAISPAARQRIKAAKPTQEQPAAQPADKIIVSNLPQDVNEQQVKELFHTTVGPLREVTLHYDSAGRSKGVASVQFSRKGDGTKAFQQYNNRLIDGKRPMKIEIVFDPTRAAPGPSLASRVAPAAAAVVQPNATRNATRGSARRGRRVGNKARKNDRPAKSAADLDAEMEVD
jgi:THO complex subunit 4